MKKIISIIGVVAILFIAYWFLIVVPSRKSCVSQAEQRYSQATTNAREGLIDSTAYKQAGDQLQMEINNCYK